MTSFPRFTWEELTRQLFDLAPADVRVMIPHLISASKKLGREAHPALSSTSVFAIAAVLLDGDFRPHLSAELFGVSDGCSSGVTPKFLS